MCSKYNINPLMEWNSFNEWLISETNRLISHFKVDGKNIPLRSTLPIGGEELVNDRIIFQKSCKKKSYWYKDTIKAYKLNPPNWLKIQL